MAWNIFSCLPKCGAGTHKRITESGRRGAPSIATEGCYQCGHCCTTQRVGGFNVTGFVCINCKKVNRVQMTEDGGRKMSVFVIPVVAERAVESSEAMDGVAATGEEPQQTETAVNQENQSSDSTPGLTDAEAGSLVPEPEEASVPGDPSVQVIALKRLNSTTFEELSTEEAQTDLPVEEALPDEKAQSIPPCSVCMDAAADMLFLPCAHGGLCEACAKHIATNKAAGGAHCPRCRAGIAMVLRIAEVPHINRVLAVPLRDCTEEVVDENLDDGDIESTETSIPFANKKEGGADHSDEEVANVEVAASGTDALASIRRSVANEVTGSIRRSTIITSE